MEFLDMPNELNGFSDWTLNSLSDRVFVTLVPNKKIPTHMQEGRDPTEWKYEIA